MVGTPNRYYRVSSADRAPLRIGLILDSQQEVPAFVARIIEDIKASNFAGIELLISGKTDARRPTPVPILYGLYLRLDARLKPADDPLARGDCTDLLSKIETLYVEPAGKDSVYCLPA